MKRFPLALTILTFLVPVVAFGQTETVVYFHTDAVGSVRMVTDETGAVVEEYDYWPFGVPVQSEPETRRFAGKERDAETGFDYFGARHSAGQTGRFTTVDPVLPIADALVDPQRWNRYSYALNNSFRFVDPDGRYSTDCAKDDAACQERISEFESARQRLLRHEDPRVRSAAAAYGEPNEENGVILSLAAYSGTDAWTNPVLSQPYRPLLRVAFGSDLHGTDLHRAIAHEGSHLRDDFAYINSGFRPALNPTVGETEFRAFVVGASASPYSFTTTCSGAPCSFAFGPMDVGTIREFLRRSDQYGGRLGNRIFPR